MAVRVSAAVPSPLRRWPFRARRARGAHQEAAGVRAAVADGRVAELSATLDEFHTDGHRSPGIPFPELYGVHFARMVLLTDAVDLRGRTIAASLVYLADVDGSADAHLYELAGAAAAGVDATFGLCEGYPQAPTPTTRLAFLREHVLATQAPYVNTIGRTVDQIRHESALRDAIADFLDRTDLASRGTDPAGVRAAVQDFVRGDPRLRWACRRAPRPPLGHRIRERLHAVAVPAGLLAVSPAVISVLPAWALLLRLHEKTDPAPHLRPDPEHLERLLALEDHAAQNQFTVVGLVKPGPFRAITVRVLLWLTAFATRHVFNRADLAGVTTIHFARWVVIDDGRRVIFTSNYDGSVESYMDDFIDKVAWGLNALFSNGVGYPRTRWLLLDGARDEQPFKDILRRRQIPTQVWYAAYDQLSASNLRNNQLIRSGLFGPLNRFDTATWVARL
jgi:hypothetical protein